MPRRVRTSIVEETATTGPAPRSPGPPANLPVVRTAAPAIDQGNGEEMFGIPPPRLRRSPGRGEITPWPATGFAALVALGLTVGAAFDFGAAFDTGANFDIGADFDMGTGAIALAQEEPYAARARALVGQIAPPIQVEAVVGNEPTNLAALRGHVVILVFYSTYCSSCAIVAEKVDTLVRSRRGRDLRAIGITQDPPTRLRAVHRATPRRFPVGVGDSASFERYAARYLPTVAVIDGQGTIRHVLVGANEAGLRQLDEAVASLLPSAERR